MLPAHFLTPPADEAAEGEGGQDAGAAELVEAIEEAKDEAGEQPPGDDAAGEVASAREGRWWAQAPSTKLGSERGQGEGRERG